MIKYKARYSASRQCFQNMPDYQKKILWSYTNPPQILIQCTCMNPLKIQMTLNLAKKWIRSAKTSLKMLILLSREDHRYHRMIHYYLQYVRWEGKGKFALGESRSAELDLILTDQRWIMVNTIIIPMHLSLVGIQYERYWLCQNYMVSIRGKLVMSYHFQKLLLRVIYICKYQRYLKLMNEEQVITFSISTGTFMIRSRQEGFGKSTWQIS